MRSKVEHSSLIVKRDFGYKKVAYRGLFGFAQVENWGSQVYFAHPYTSWELPQNARHNGLFLAFVPKGVSIESFSPKYILSAADELNGCPRKKLGYRTPEELFEKFLDSVYAASGCGSIVHGGSQRLTSWTTL